MPKFASEISNPLKNAVNDQIAREVGDVAQFIIQERTSQGKFLGGPLANKGYSTNPIMAFKLGDVTYDGGGGITVKNEVAGGPVSYGPDELDWGKKGAIALGGYKRFRQKIGRETSKVTLTLSGAMFVGFNYVVRKAANSVRIVFGVKPADNAKAFFTNQQRRWLGLSNSEARQIAKLIEDKFFKGL